MTGAVPAAVALATLHGCIGEAADGDPHGEDDGIGAIGTAPGATQPMPAIAASRLCRRGPASCRPSAPTSAVTTMAPRTIEPRWKRRRIEGELNVMGWACSGGNRNWQPSYQPRGETRKTVWQHEAPTDNARTTRVPRLQCAAAAVTSLFLASPAGQKAAREAARAASDALQKARKRPDDDPEPKPPKPPKPIVCPCKNADKDESRKTGQPDTGTDEFAFVQCNQLVQGLRDEQVQLW